MAFGGRRFGCCPPKRASNGFGWRRPKHASRHSVLSVAAPRIRGGRGGRGVQARFWCGAARIGGGRGGRVRPASGCVPLLRQPYCWRVAFGRAPCRRCVSALGASPYLREGALRGDAAAATLARNHTNDQSGPISPPDLLVHPSW